MDEHSEKLEDLTKSQENKNRHEMKMKNTIEGIKIRLNDTEEQISELVDRVVEITQAEKKE